MTIHEKDIYTTRFYSDCIGVFQGGGCRAAAYGGAYAAAFRCGVRFSELAGTSAGAIVAALLAAGAEPDYLLNELKKLNFSALLAQPVRSTFPGRFGIVSALHAVPFKGATLDTIVKIARLGGLYSSEKIGRWVEDRLKFLTGKQSGPVEFRDLPVPLHVVAGDLSSMKARVWSSRTTPAQSVAHAVRASCSIPFFFQPVEEGSALLVDGGVVSTTPHFLFAAAPSETRSGKRALLFTLQASEERAKPEDAREFVFQLASLAVDGATDVQMRFTPDIAQITIPTGDIKATDFGKMTPQVVDQLVQSGEDATNAFIKKELLTTRPAFENDPILDEHQAFLKVAEQLNASVKQVVVAFPDTRWFWELFVTIFELRYRRARVVALLPPVSNSSLDAPKERQRRSLMQGLGIEIHETGDLPFHGFVFDGTSPEHGSALIFTGERLDYGPVAAFYSGRLDQVAIAAIGRWLLPLVSRTPSTSPLGPIERASEETLLDRLRKGVPFYNDPRVTLEMREVEVSKVLLISRFVRAFRYKQIGALIDHYTRSGLGLFEPACVRLEGGGTSLITPPVVEESGESFVALEGNTRFLYCLNNQIEKVRCVVVRGVNAELPGSPIPLKQVRITSSKHAPGERIAGFNYSLFRDIERAVRPLS